MESDFEKILKSEVLEEFEVDEKPARVIRLQLQDIDEQDLTEHARNLADTNFQLLDSVPNAEKRAVVRTRMFGIRQKLGNLPVVGGKIRDSKILDGLLNRVYPDITHEEHFRAYKDRAFPRYIGQGQVLAVEMDGRIVSVQAFNNLGKTASGRSVYEFTKASTLNDANYRGKRLNPRLKKTIFDDVMAKDPEAMWIGGSVNENHLGKLASRGWHVVEMDDSNEAIRVMYDSDPEYIKLMKEQGYKAIYLDPKVDKVTWE
ncbi:hypothetical protein CO046_03345 [Candidatus Peregrinibacteria bacterium CG_4_9_14_0_2_um_filter_53_11]|nr:MAG: hypothetical protein CO046_03345 [Candidatus Peregrinibacteria bacterium CG_4_9_14_0_2_um_filter_53_11]